MAREKLKELMREYSNLAEKYALQPYVKMNEDFDIEKLSEVETDTLLREIRKVAMEKILSYLRFVELLLNPGNAPLFFFALLKGLDSGDKKVLDDIYVRLGRLEIGAIDVDIEYSEKKEAEFISQVFEEWQSIKKGMKTVSHSLQRGWDKKSEKKDKSYLG